MYRWLITIEAWPHSTGNGAEEDQKLAGERVQQFKVMANDMSGAVDCAKLIARGMETNPMVWKAPIMAIVRNEEHD